MASETQGSPAGEKKLEQYGVWVKVKPREVLETASREASVDLSDLESPASSAPQKAGSAKSALTAEEEKLLDELDTELGSGGAAAGALVPDEEPLLAETELPDIEAAAPRAGAEDLVELTEEELPELDDEPLAPMRGIRKPFPAPAETEIEVTLSEGTGKGDHFDDLAELETELASVSTPPRAGSAASSQILARIEKELRSIRTDLTQLRTELSGLRGKAARQPSAEAARADSAGGFFDEDEDETIALTGDELDNILNTADITEEPAEAATADLETLDLIEETDETEETEEIAETAPGEDILSYEETLSPKGKTPGAAEEDIELAEAVPAADDTLVLADDSLLAGDEEGTAELEELPSELVLEDLGEESRAGRAGEKGALESRPDFEPSSAAGGASKNALDDTADETIDLETLDIGEEPRVIDAVPEQVEDLETIVDAEPVFDTEPTEFSAAAAADDVLSDDVDLEALAAEAEELQGDVPLRPSRDLELGELEGVDEEDGPALGAAEEIQIPFEADAPKPSPDIDAELEQILDAEEVLEEPPAAGRATAPSLQPTRGASGIPDNLKDEIRTVLKYMDHLLEALPDEKIQEFASSDYFVMYKKLFEDLGLGE